MLIVVTRIMILKKLLKCSKCFPEHFLNTDVLQSSVVEIPDADEVFIREFALYICYVFLLFLQYFSSINQVVYAEG